MSNRRFDIIDDLTRIYKGQRYSKGDFTDKVVDGLLAELIGIPGVSGGKAKLQDTSSGSSAYTSAQQDPALETPEAGSYAASGAFGLISSLLAMAHADMAAKKAFERQNDFYDNHISMPAKVQEYQEAGLNPLGLAGSGVGATSAPSVDMGQTPDIGSTISGLLGNILNYKLGMKELAAKNREIDIQGKNVASEIDYRATQKLYQEKINDWFDANQIASIEKMQAETKDALQRVNTGEADELLKLAGVSKTEAESALIFQEELQKLWENSPEWKQVELELKRAQTRSGNANAQNLYADIERLQAQRDNLIADGFLKVAQTDLGKQQLKNMGLEEKQIEFAISHQKGDLIWNRVGQVAGALKDVGFGIGAAMTPFKGIPINSGSHSQTSTIVTDRKGNVVRSTESFTSSFPNKPESERNTFKLK